MHLTGSMMIVLLALMAGPPLLALCALLLLARCRRRLAQRVLLALLLPQGVIAGLLLWPGGLDAVGMAPALLAWLLLLCAGLTLLLSRWRRLAWRQALVSGWVVFILLIAGFWFYPPHQSSIKWARHQQLLQHNLALLQQQKWAELDALPAAQQRELFYRAVEQDYPAESYRYFIRHGFSPLDRQEFGYTPLSNAIAHYNPEALGIFLALLTPAQIQTLTFDYDALRDLRLDPPYYQADRARFYRSMALLLKARPDWIHPRDSQAPSYLTVAIFNGYLESVHFLLAYLPPPQGVWQLALLALNGKTQPLLSALQQQPARLEETFTDGKGVSLSLMAWLIKFSAKPTRKALLDSGLIDWQRFQRTSARGEVENTLVSEARGNWRFRDETPTVLQQVLVSAVQQHAELPAVQLLDILRYDDAGETLTLLLQAGMPCAPLQRAAAQMRQPSAEDIRSAQRMSAACSAPHLAAK